MSDARWTILLRMIGAIGMYVITEKTRRERFADIVMEGHGTK